MMVSRAEVAVVIAAYNAEATLLDALDSVLASTCPVHVFIVDDASTVPVATFIAEQRGAIPENLEIIRQSANLGPAAARNRAMRRIMDLGFAFAALLDADDIAHVHRFTCQKAYLDDHPDVAVVGTWGNWIDEASKSRIGQMNYPPLSPPQVRLALCFDSCLINSSVMFRVSTLCQTGLWDESMYTAEDYELFCRINRYHALANIPSYLVDIRVSSRGISRGGVRAQRLARLQVQLRHLSGRWMYWQAWLGISISTVRILVPTSWVEGYKRAMNRRTVF